MVVPQRVPRAKMNVFFLWRDSWENDTLTRCICFDRAWCLCCKSTFFFFVPTLQYAVVYWPLRNLVVRIKLFRIRRSKEDAFGACNYRRGRSTVEVRKLKMLFFQEKEIEKSETNTRV